MCATCGCGTGAKATLANLQTGSLVTLARSDHDDDHDHVHADGTRHSHGQSHGHGSHEHVDADGTRHRHSHDHDHAHSHGVTANETLETRILAKNDARAALNRAWFSGRDILALNLVSSPGSGKTTLLEATIRDLKRTHALFVVEGDQATANDGERIRAAGAPCVQLNTGTGCHLEADMIARGLAELKPSTGSVVLIENVGNLVCPALFDLGERAKVAILSVTEGEDKPLKYPHMFAACDVMLLNKIDLLPHLDFDVEKAITNAKEINPEIIIFPVSAKSGDGLRAWYDWIDQEMAAARVHSFTETHETATTLNHKALGGTLP